MSRVTELVCVNMSGNTFKTKKSFKQTLSYAMVYKSTKHWHVVSNGQSLLSRGKTLEF